MFWKFKHHARQQQTDVSGLVWMPATNIDFFGCLHGDDMHHGSQGPSDGLVYLFLRTLWTTPKISSHRARLTAGKARSDEPSNHRFARRRLAAA